MGTKENPGRFDCYGAAALDEPIFILRATDPGAPDAIRHWAAQYRQRKIGQKDWGEKQVEKFLEALDTADKMQQYHQKKTREIADAG